MARSVLFSAMVLVAAVYLLIYILLSVPALQNKLRIVVQREVSAFIGGEVSIGALTIKPFNEVVISGLEVRDRSGSPCLKVETVGAGINIWRLITGGGIELSYGEIIGLDASLSQEEKGGPLNIGFIIDAFSPKDREKPSAQFSLNLRNVVLRRCQLSFDKNWIPPIKDEDRLDFNHIRVTDLRADITFPHIGNDGVDVDMRRLSFKAEGGLDVEKIAFRANVSDKELSVRDLIVALPETELHPSDIFLTFDGLKNIAAALSEGSHRIVMADNKVSLPDFGWLMPGLRGMPNNLVLNLDVSGNSRDVHLSRLDIEGGKDLLLELSGELRGLQTSGEPAFSADNLRLIMSRELVGQVISLLPGLSAKAASAIRNCGDVFISATGRGDLSDGDYETDCEVSLSCGSVFLSAVASGFKGGSGVLRGELTVENLNGGALLSYPSLGNVGADILFDATVRGKDIDGELNAYLSGFEYNGTEYGGVALEMTKDSDNVSGHLAVSNEMADLRADVMLNVSKDNPWANIQCDVDRVVPSLLTPLPKYGGYLLSTSLSADLSGTNIDNVTGEIRLTDTSFMSPEGNGLNLDKFVVTCASEEDGHRVISLSNDWFDGEVEGDFRIAEIPAQLQDMLSNAIPSLVSPSSRHVMSGSDVEFALMFHPVNDVPEFFNLPFRFLVPVSVEGSVLAADSTASLAVDVPYIQQGRNKLVRDTRLSLSLDGGSGTFEMDGASTFPAKKGEVAVDFRVWGHDDNVLSDIGWHSPSNSSFKGLLSLGAHLWRGELTSRPEVEVEVSPSTFDMGAARWNIDKGTIRYGDGNLTVKGVRLWHDDQFVEIEGTASASASDSISVRLADIDVDYIFDILKINYVTFGGIATGEVKGRGVLGPDPLAETERLSIRDLSYNGAVLGDGEMYSRWDHSGKKVAIRADVAKDGRRRALIDGGVWVTRDSLSFDIEADKVPVDFLQPFMGAFSSDVKGRASGHAKLFGTFSDIDLTGKLYADSLSMKLDYTNTYYHGSDSVFLYPGHISIPSFRLYDRDGHSALLSGELKHRYFHDPSFTFRISDARRLLCYDTNAKMNPDWYGTLYGDGSAVVRGWPGTVAVSVDMTIVGKSAFTFVLNDTQAAEDYQFLTFSDRRKEEAERMRRDTVPDPLSAFRKKIETASDVPSRFGIDIRASVTPSALMTLVMDPVAGDKILARGSGAVQVDYETDSDEMQMFGKYTLDEGSYNFSLQDLILRDFTIRPGSTISFNGDPLDAHLDIAASYRVNTNLSDLDKSFSTDRDLARTNVPVDAILMVNGDMQHPEISFDIELPTLTQDVERKVKSIISTDDMMSRQIIYLLALNRFYTPEYMGASGNGGELAAVASTTLSSQLSNMIGQLTDKFTLSPSFRSDKGDFSDLEVDVALSSRLLNNRLLVNGNFGYRDRSTSQTTFVGDFDIEYLLSRGGNLRLKAYNHFNDQNYYLRQALTTQGIGVVYRRDFDNPFTFLRRRKKNSQPSDSGSDCVEPPQEEKEDSFNE